MSTFFEITFASIDLPLIDKILETGDDDVHMVLYKNLKTVASPKLLEYMDLDYAPAIGTLILLHQLRTIDHVRYDFIELLCTPDINPEASVSAIELICAAPPAVFNELDRYVREKTLHRLIETIDDIIKVANIIGDEEEVNDAMEYLHYNLMRLTDAGFDIDGHIQEEYQYMRPGYGVCNEIEDYLIEQKFLNAVDVQVYMDFMIK
jgi:hypothetical protein